MSISLQPVSPEDLATIDRWASVIGSAFISRTRPKAEVADQHDPASGLFWYLVIEDGREVGTVWIERLPGESGAVLGAFLGSPSDFGRGIGKAALRIAISEFRQAFPHESISLNVRQSNERALGCYRSVGFEITGTGSKMSSSGDPITFYTMVWSPHSSAADAPNAASEQTRPSSRQDRGVSARRSTPHR
jgi:RimJ/RimL family protein N-acetyltransferase